MVERVSGEEGSHVSQRLELPSDGGGRGEEVESCLSQKLEPSVMEGGEGRKGVLSVTETRAPCSGSGRVEVVRSSLPPPPLRVLIYDGCDYLSPFFLFHHWDSSLCRKHKYLPPLFSL